MSAAAQDGIPHATRGAGFSRSGVNAPVNGTLNDFALPSSSLPKGGGAIQGIGEKIAANSANGTMALTVPIATSPGRNGFGPQLALSYNSGFGNGPVGWGCKINGLTAITISTERRYPEYNYATESDDYMLSDTEDLVPLLDSNGKRQYDKNADPDFIILRYRPRVDTMFARIERWTHKTSGDVHWRSISKDNVLSIYGKDRESRIFDPDPTKSLNIFSWLICEVRDDKGNAVLYKYKEEDGIDVDLTSASERNRGDRNDRRRKSNRYIKRILYGNRKPLLNESGRRPRLLTDLPAAQLEDTEWMFEVVFDYGEHDKRVPTPIETGTWRARRDPHSSYLPGFEVRTIRLCRRVLMFHHIPNGYDGLVRSTDFTYDPQDSDEAQDSDYAHGPVYTFLQSVTHTGYRRVDDGYVKRSMPPLSFEYSQPIIQETVENVDHNSLEHMPIGVDGASYSFLNLFGEACQNVFIEQGSNWFIKRNLSAVNNGKVKFGPLEPVKSKPNVTLSDGRSRLMDLAGEGFLDVVVPDGVYEHDDNESWQPFRPFPSRVNFDLRDPNLRFIDLDGDGNPDFLINELDELIAYEAVESDGFRLARRISVPLDEEKGPRVVFANETESIHILNMCGYGLAIARFRNGECCYWPHLGFGLFGAKVTMDNAPVFDSPDQFDVARLLFADIDGTGTMDVIYPRADGVVMAFNQSGNGWSRLRRLNAFPLIDNTSRLTVTDLLGNGTSCLVWSSPLPEHSRQPMRYVNLMGDQKPHLLIKIDNGHGAQTNVRYASSVKFYLKDKLAGRPWITAMPTQVFAVESIEVCDKISGDRFVTEYGYSNGHYDTVDRQFRGFAEMRALAFVKRAPSELQTDAPTTSINFASDVPPVLTKTWYHTGIYIGRNHVSDFFAGLVDGYDKGDYYREPDIAINEVRALLLPDTILPDGLTTDEEREACRALKGSMLRQEIYALDGTDKEPHPYSVVEQNFRIRCDQGRSGTNRHGVFFVHPYETITYHYERDPTDPRIQHTIRLEVDAFGNPLKDVNIGYGRRQPEDAPTLPVEQTRTLVTFTDSLYSNAIDDLAEWPDEHRTPLLCETRTYELSGYTPSGPAGPAGWRRFLQSDFVQDSDRGSTLKFDRQLDYTDLSSTGKECRKIEHVRTLYRSDDLTSILGLGQLEPRAFLGETYNLAFTPKLLELVYERDGQALLPTPDNVLGGTLADRGGYVSSQDLKADGRVPITDPNGYWWVPSARAFMSPNSDDTFVQELAYAKAHFFLPLRVRNPFHSTADPTESFVAYDDHDLLIVETRDPLGNRVSVGERDDTGTLTANDNDYRVLQPQLVMDANRNRSAVSFDALGMVVGTAVMGKPEQREGDNLQDFDPDLSKTTILGHLADPLNSPHDILGSATTRIVYDLFAYERTKDQSEPRPNAVYAIARETHQSDLKSGQQSKVQHSFTYFDGFGRVIMKKAQAEPGPVPQRDANGKLKLGPDNLPLMTANDVAPRWVGSGTVENNIKGDPWRQWQPFFSDRHGYEADVKIGVSATLFYDPAGRVIGKLHPNHTYEKVAFGPWQQVTWDVNDTLAPPDNDGVPFNPKSDPDVGTFFKRLPDEDYLPTWYDLRIDHEKALEKWPERDDQGDLLPDAVRRDNAARRMAEADAARKALAHSGTPTTVFFDTLGRPFLTLADNGPDPSNPNQHLQFATRVELDIESNQRVVRDALKQADDDPGRIVMRYDYDMLGNRIHQESMEAGQRWMVNDVTGKPIRAWDSRGHIFRTEYDTLRRPKRIFVTGADPDQPDVELLTECLVYGEQHPQSEQFNLRGRVHLHLDQAGMAITGEYDFKGNALNASRRLATEYRRSIDWTATNGAFPASSRELLDAAAFKAALAPVMETDTYATSTKYDALNRVMEQTTPHTEIMKPNVIRLGYNEANLLERIDVNLRGAVSGTARVWTPFVTGIEYDAKAQRKQIGYGNGAKTSYEYDQLTFRLTRLHTQRDTAQFPGDRAAAAGGGWPGADLQDFHYTTDCQGNFTNIYDRAQQAIFFRNKRVEPSNDYTYDAIYRLIEAKGREHLGQIGGSPIPHSWNDARRVGIESAGPNGRFGPNDGNAMGTYVERYIYDAVGNFLEMHHLGTDPVDPGWKRTYSYDEESQIESEARGLLPKTSNRLSATEISNHVHSTEQYAYDAHGNMTRMDHLPSMIWDYRDQLCATSRQVVHNGGTPEITYYVYDGSGQRMRKVTDRQTAAGRPVVRKEERIYLGGLEVYREYEIDSALKLERETLHIVDDRRRIALVETRTDRNVEQLIRYQLGNHLGSVCLELDEQAQIISFEELSPFGSRLYCAVRSLTEGRRRFILAGNERDEESGLCYHGARYYTPWLGRWTSCDPSGLIDGTNLFQYSQCRPTYAKDPTGHASIMSFEEFQSSLRDTASELNKHPGELIAKDRRTEQPKSTLTANPVEGSPIHGSNFKDKGQLVTGPYEDVGGHHVDQSSAYKNKSRVDPMRKDALSASQSEGAFSQPGPQSRSSNSVAHERAGQVQSAVDQARLGREVHLDLPADSEGKLPATSVHATGEGKLIGGPSQWAEDVKGQYGLLAGGAHPEDALNAAHVAAEERKAAGMLPTKIPAKGQVWNKVKEGVATLAKNAAKSPALKALTVAGVILGHGVAKAAPIVGTAVGAADVANEAASGDVRRTALSALGMSEIPGVSQAADIGLAVEDAGWAAKEILDPERRLEDWYYNAFIK